MKWTDMAVALALIALVGWLGSGVISCARDYMVEEGTASINLSVEFPMDTKSLEEHGYISVNGGDLEQGGNFTIEIEGYIDTYSHGIFSDYPEYLKTK